MQLKQASVFLKSVPMLSNIMPILRCFYVYDGRIQVANLDVIVDIPCKSLKGLKFTAPIDIFLKAIIACDYEPTYTVLDADRLEVRRGSFKTKIPLFKHEDYPCAEQGICNVSVPKKNLIELFKRAAPFAGNSKAATLHWSNGILFRGGYLYATNTKTVMRQPVNFSLPREVTVNLDMLKTLISIGEEPEAVGLEGNFICFKYHNGAWVKCRLLEDKWPDVTHFFDTTASELVPKGLVATAANMMPFSERDEFISDGSGHVRTEDGDYCARDEGIALPPCAYRLSELVDILMMADKFDFSTYPQSAWSGPGVEGMTVGIRIS